VIRSGAIAFISLMKQNGILIQSMPLWLITLLLFPRMNPGSFNTELQRILKLDPLLVLVIGQGVMFVLFFIPAWSMGINPPLRVYNFITPFWLLWFTWLITTINHKYGKVLLGTWPVYKGMGLRVMVAVIALSFMVSFVKVPNGELVFGGNTPRAMYDLLFRAAGYNRNMKEREEAILKALAKGETEVVVPALADPPGTIFFIDMTSDPDHWINALYARHYGVGRVRVGE
jgi:hypothetical protein